jgi:two-component system LytT family response regulator
VKTLIIDDERLARKELRRLLAGFPDLEILGEAANAQEAREQIAAWSPEVIFLDIQMPRETGTDLLESLEPPLPEVIFTTAHDEFAVKAFELDAVDYLVKPVDPARLTEAVAKLRLKLQKRPSRDTPAVRAKAPLAADEKVFVRDGDRCWFVQVGQIRLLESEGNYTRVYFDEVRPQLFRSLSAMEERLDSQHFFRANRSQIINLDWIEKIEPWFSGGLQVYLKGGAKIELSRRQAQEFREKTSL